MAALNPSVKAIESLIAKAINVEIADFQS